MTLEKAIEKLIDKWNEAQQYKHIKNPIAWALYQVWKEANEEKINDY